MDRDYITPTHLYYRSWYKWAELQVWQSADGII